MQCILLLQKSLDNMDDIEYCPRCQAAVIREAEENLKLACCTNCMYSFCTMCHDAWHAVSIDLLVDRVSVPVTAFFVADMLPFVAEFKGTQNLTNV